MAKSTVGLDIKALSKAAQKELAGIVSAKAGAIRDAASAQVPDDVPVEMRMEENAMGAPVGLVTITHPSGMARQARDGVLTRAAASGGMDITRSSS